MPAGGSLTADQWFLLATVQGPVIVSGMQIISDQRSKPCVDPSALEGMSTLGRQPAHPRSPESHRTN